MSGHKFLPYGRHDISDADVAAVVAVLRSDALTTGPLVEVFEQAFASASGAAHAISCNSGTAALHLACMGVGLGPGLAAIVPSITFVATANAVRMTGAEVVFADVDSETGLLTAAHLAAAIRRAQQQGLQLRAAMPVHLNGQSCDMQALAQIADATGIDLIEDACHAFGAPGIGACTHSKFACFSTHPVKAVATGEGGVLTTSDAELARRARQLRSHGLEREAIRYKDKALSLAATGEPHPWSYEMHEIGWNYRMPDILCALGISQIKRLAAFQARRREIAGLYDRELTALAPALRPVPHGVAAHGWHLYPVLIDFEKLGRTRNAVMAQLRDSGIGTQVHYIPVHRQPYYNDRGRPELPGAEAYYGRCLSLPFYTTLRDDEVQRVVTALTNIVKANA